MYLVGVYGVAKNYITDKYLIIIKNTNKASGWVLVIYQITGWLKMLDITTFILCRL